GARPRLRGSRSAEAGASDPRAALPPAARLVDRRGHRLELRRRGREPRAAPHAAPRPRVAPPPRPGAAAPRATLSDRRPPLRAAPVRVRAALAPARREPAVDRLALEAAVRDLARAADRPSQASLQPRALEHGGGQPSRAAAARVRGPAEGGAD